ncbi:MAG: hypothetical protein IKS22_02735 [Bacteroidales bacterium]|nr:hypothetical protein [Bacteroidales bacterium]
MNAQVSIDILQLFATGLSAQSYAHKVQGKVFASQGLSVLGDKYSEHSSEEMGYVEKFIDRILDLGGSPKVQAAPEAKIFSNPVDFLKEDYKVSVNGIELLRKSMDAVKEDATTYDILKEYLKDEEQDMYWSEQQLSLIDMIGLQNWLVKQL